LVKRGLRGTKLAIPRKSFGFRGDAHEGLKAATRRVMGATWQRCRVHWMRNAPAYVPQGQQSMASLRQAFLQEDAEKAHQVWRAAADAMRQRWPQPLSLRETPSSACPWTTVRRRAREGQGRLQHAGAALERDRALLHDGVLVRRRADDP